MSSTYAAAELIWYLSRTQSIRGILPYANQYKLFANDGLAMGAYGDRIARNCGVDQLDALVGLLSDSPHTRRAVLAMWAPTDLPHAIADDWNDLPCTLTWQFTVRESKLNMTCTMRSQDLWLGLPYDVFVNTTIQRMLAAELGLEPGFYTHQCGSLHLYEKHWSAAEEARSSPAAASKAVDLTGLRLAHQQDLVELERVIRSTRGKASVLDCEPWTSLPDGARNLVACVSSWWGLELPCTCPNLMKGMRLNADYRGN